MPTVPTVTGQNPYDEAVARLGEAPPRDEAAERTAQVAAITGDATDKYDFYLSNLEAQREQAARAAGIAAAQHKPDEYVGLLDLSKQAGLPVGVVESDPEAVRQDLRLQQWADMARKSPQVAAWLSVADNAVLAQDDLEPLSMLEAALRPLGDVAMASPNEFNRAFASGIRGLGDLNDALAFKIDQGLRAVGLDAVADVGQTEIPWWANPSNWARGAGDWLEDTFVVDLPEERRNVATDISGGLGNLVAQILITRVNPYAGGTMMAGQGADNQAQRADKAGADQAAKSDAVLMGATITAVTEKMGLDLLLDRVPPAIKNRYASYLADKLIAGGVEGTQEGLEAIANNAVAQSLYDPESGLMDGVAYDATIGGTVGLIARTVLGTRLRRVESSKALSDQQLLDALVGSAAGTKLRERDPARYAELVATLAKPGADTVYVPVEEFQRYFQSAAMDPQAVAAEAGVSYESYQEAVLTGGDVAIPMAQYLAKVGPEHHKALGEFARMTPGGLTPAEAKMSPEELAQEVARFNEQVNIEAGSDRRVYDDVYGMLMGTGRFERDAVERYATLTNAFFRTMSEREGKDALALYEPYRLRIKSELPAVLQDSQIDVMIDPLIERLRVGDIPTDRDAYGLSLVDFLVARGGLMVDQGMAGEVRRVAESDRATRKGKPRLVRDDGMPLDSALEAAVESGYLPQGADIQALLDALDSELVTDRPVFAASGRDTRKAADREALLALGDELDRLGINTAEATNEAIKQALFGGGRVPEALVQVFDQTVFHGSPHQFDRFSLSRIGTGEGAQAYGWGLYFASRREVAEHYRKAISRARADAASGWIDSLPSRIQMDVFQALKPSSVERRVANVEAIKDRLGEHYDAVMERARDDGKLYTAEIPEDTDLLDWDAPLDKQPEKVRAAVRIRVIGLASSVAISGKQSEIIRVNQRIADGDVTGASLYNDLAGIVGSPQIASRILNAAGIPGLRYLDGTSRGAGDGSRNYVIWDEGAIGEVRTLYQSAPAAQTDTPEFRRWFGDSKVVDADGRPLVVYHGSNKPLERIMSAAERMQKFDENTRGLSETLVAPERSALEKTAGAMWFTEDDGVAYGYSGQRDGVETVTEVYLSIQNPLDLRNADVVEVERILTEARGKDVSIGLEYGESKGIAQAIVRDNGSLVQWAKKNGYDGLIYPDTDVRGRGLHTSYVTFSPGQIKSATGNRGTFDPNNPSILEQSNRTVSEAIRRGYIAWNADRQFTIGLTKDADLTTFLHESGHFFMEVMGDLAAQPDASDALKADYAAILNWLGVESRDQVGVEQHEKLARGFEAYLGEGKAPTAELAGAFARFRGWVLAVYRSLRNLNVELSDEVRGVFDRMLATDAEIQAAERDMGYEPLFNEAARAGMTEAQFATYLRLQEEARREAQEALAAKAIKQVRDAQEAERDDLRDEVAREVHAMPVYQALYYLSRGKLPDGSPLPDGMEPGKLDGNILRDRYGQEFLNRYLLRRGVYSNSGGLDPDLLATAFGFPSGDKLVEALANAQPMKAYIEARVDQRLRERYGDMVTDGSLPAEAVAAVHNTRRMKALEAEVQALGRLTGQPAPSSAQLRRVAEAIVAGVKYRSLQPNSYLRAERRAAREAMQAATRGDMGRALEAKRRQMLNAHLYDQAVKVKAEGEKLLRYVKRFEKGPLRERLGKTGRLEQVDAMLDGYDLRRLSGRAIDRNKAKGELLSAILAGTMVAPKAVVDQLKTDGTRTNWQELTVENMRGLRDVLAQIEAETRAEYEALVNGEKVLLDEKADAIAGDTLTGGEEVALAYGQEAPDEAVRRYGRNALMAWLRPATLARVLQGNKDTGGWTNWVIEPIRRAVVEKLEPMRRDAQERLAKLMGDHFSVKEISRMHERSVVPGLEVALSRWDLIGIALNWGNAENRKAILESTFPGSRQPFTQAGIENALSTLTENEWSYVQGAWDLVDSYWPQIEAAQKRRKGIAPPKVQAEPFVQKLMGGGEVTLRGGYYPLKYNGRLNAKARNAELEDAWERMRAGTLSSVQTKYGHTIERVGSGGQPVDLSINVLYGHVNNVVMDLALADEVSYVDRVLRRPQVVDALIRTGNMDALETFKLWLKDVAVGDQAARDGWSQMAQFIRFGFTKSKIGFNLMTVGLQITGLPQTIVVVGKKAFALGAASYTKNPRQAVAQVMEQSAFMKARYELNAFNRDISDIQRALTSGAPPGRGQGWLGNFLAAVRTLQMPAAAVSWAFAGIRVTQMQVDTVTWLAGYEGGKAQGMDHAAAVKYADGMVEKAQTSGLFQDRAGIERGTLSQTVRQAEWVKLLTTLQSVMIAKGNIGYEAYKRTDFKSVPSVLSFSLDIVMLFTVEGILVAALRGEWPEEEDDWFGWLLGMTAESMAGTIPVVREIPSAAKGFNTGGPLGGVINDVVRAAKQTEQAELDAALIKSYMNIIGTATGLPSAQINRAVDAYWREFVEGEDVAAIEYVTGRRGN